MVRVSWFGGYVSEEAVGVELVDGGRRASNVKKTGQVHRLGGQCVIVRKRRRETAEEQLEVNRCGRP